MNIKPLMLATTFMCVPAFGHAGDASTPPAPVTVPAIDPRYVLKPSDIDAPMPTAVEVPDGNTLALPPTKPQDHSASRKEKRGLSYAATWQGDSGMPAKGADGSVVFTFGETMPVIVGAPLFVTIISLQPGETLNDLNAGDQVRWKITPATSGSGTDAVTQIMVKPTESGLTTNLVITTNRRTYSMKLVSREQEWMPLVSFAYPEDSQAKWVAFQASQERQREATTLSSGEDIAKLDFNYRMSGDDPAWKPLRVYSNGVKTFIQFPASVSHAELPTLVALGTDGDLFTSPSQRLVNYRLIGDRFEVDQVLANAALIAGVGGEQERVSIAHLGGHNGTP